MVERPVTIESDAHLSPQFPVKIFDTALAFTELSVLTGLFRDVGKEQGAAEALGAVAVGVGELVGGVHAQPFGTQGHPIGSTAFSRDGHAC